MRKEGNEERKCRITGRKEGSIAMSASAPSRSMHTPDLSISTSA